tara:strand:+ start:186 stop:347 length:162 start_codon:yes stop_codon:yes gene_type:complete
LIEEKILNQIHKTINKYGKVIEEIEKDIAVLKKDSHPPIEALEERLKKLEKEK